MNQEKLALELGLAKDADEAAISAALAKLKTESAKAEKLRAECDTLRVARIETLVNGAVAEKKIGEDKKQHFMELGKKIGASDLKATFDAMSPQVKLSNLIGHQGGEPNAGQGGYEKLSDVPACEIEKLKKESPALYKQLYKKEYGFECEI